MGSAGDVQCYLPQWFMMFTRFHVIALLLLDACAIDVHDTFTVPFKPLPFQRSTDGGSPNCVIHWHDHYWSSDHGGVPSIGLLHSYDYTKSYDFSHQLMHTAITLYLSMFTCKHSILSTSFMCVLFTCEILRSSHWRQQVSFRSCSWDA